jgi:hypothetical protein
LGLLIKNYVLRGGRCLMNWNLNYSKQELADIWHNMNNWEWDNRLGTKPDNWDDIPNYNLSNYHKNVTKHDTIHPILAEIEKKIGLKYCLKWFNVHKSQKMTNLEFEFFWLKEMILKLFGFGFYGYRTQQKLKSSLKKIAQQNREEWIHKTYNNDK